MRTKRATATRGASALVVTALAVTAAALAPMTAQAAVSGTATVSATYTCDVLGQTFDLPVDFTVTATPSGSATQLSASGGRPTLPLDSAITATNVTSTLASTVDGKTVSLQATTPSLTVTPGTPVELPTLTGRAEVSGTSLQFAPGNFSMSFTYLIKVTIACTLKSVPAAVRIGAAPGPAPTTPPVTSSPAPPTSAPSSAPSSAPTTAPTTPSVPSPPGTTPSSGPSTAPGLSAGPRSRPRLTVKLSKKSQRAGAKPATVRVRLTPTAGKAATLRGTLRITAGKRLIATRTVSGARTHIIRLPRSLTVGRTRIQAAFTPAPGVRHTKVTASARFTVKR